MAPFRLEAEADVLGALGFEKVGAAQEDTQVENVVMEVSYVRPGAAVGDAAVRVA